MACATCLITAWLNLLGCYLAVKRKCILWANYRLASRPVGLCHVDRDAACNGPARIGEVKFSINMLNHRSAGVLAVGDDAVGDTHTGE